MKNLHVRRDDTVIIVSGDDKGTIGKVLQVSPKEGKIIVEGANIVKKHVRPRPPKENGGIVEVEAAMYASKVQLYCEACAKAGKSGHTRPAYKIEDGKKTRVCAKCGAEL